MSAFTDHVLSGWVIPPNGDVYLTIYRLPVVPTARPIVFIAPPKPSHKLSPLERAQQGREAKLEMLRRKPTP